MPEYTVTWVMGGIDAESPREAAEKALTIHRNPESIAVVFTVTQEGPGGRIIHEEEIDLLPEDEA
jgi:hypothetical protein